MNASSSAPCWWLALSLLAGAEAAATATAALPASEPARWEWSASEAQLQLRLLPDLLTPLGLQVKAGTDPQLLQLSLDGELRFAAPTGKLDTIAPAPIRLRGTLDWQLPAGRVTVDTLQLWPMAAPDGIGVAFDLRDASGATWLQLRHAHPQLDPHGAALDIRHMGVLTGPALATLLGDARAQGLGLGSARLQAKVLQRTGVLQPSSCAQPQWPSPSTPGDVALTGLHGYQVMRGFQMDGPGGLDGQVVVAPSATLANVGSRDMPWYTKYSGAFPPYGNDQHPYLVWALYRMDADGMLVQHARSAVKHAFFTINSGCNCNNGNVLGVGCADTYDALTNDVPFDEKCPGYAACTLGPRSEIVPRPGIWGRCGSIYDQNCNGLPEDTQPYGPFQHRLVARETDFDPAAHPGSRQWLEAWYVVRDDVSLDNNMGSTSINPVWMPMAGGGTWNFQTHAGAFHNGPVIQRWLESTPAPLASHSERLDTPEGAVQLAVRVTALPGGRYRYQYALMNLDFARAVVSGTALDPRVERAHGLNRFALLAAPGAMSGLRFIDGDRESANDWTFASSAGQLGWSAPAGISVLWGSQLSFSLETATAPRPGRAILNVAEPGEPQNHLIATLIPGPELFADGFEP